MERGVFGLDSRMGDEFVSVNESDWWSPETVGVIPSGSAVGFILPILQILSVVFFVAVQATITFRRDPSLALGMTRVTLSSP